MIYLRVRKIGIDVLPVGEPFISITIEKVTTDTNGQELQVIGDYDRIFKKLSDVDSLPIENIAVDKLVDAHEIYKMLATTVYIWVMEKHGGSIQGARLIIES